MNIENRIEKEYINYIKDKDGVLKTGQFKNILISNINELDDFNAWREIWQFRENKFPRRFIKIKRGEYLDTYFNDSLFVYLQTGSEILRKYRIKDIFNLHRIYKIKVYTNDPTDKNFTFQPKLNAENLIYFELFELFKTIQHVRKKDKEFAKSIILKKIPKSTVKRSSLLKVASLYRKEILHDIEKEYGL